MLFGRGVICATLGEGKNRDEVGFYVCFLFVVFAVGLTCIRARKPHKKTPQETLKANQLFRGEKPLPPNQPPLHRLDFIPTGCLAGGESLGRKTGGALAGYAPIAQTEIGGQSWTRLIISKTIASQVAELGRLGGVVYRRYFATEGADL